MRNAIHCDTATQYHSCLSRRSDTNTFYTAEITTYKQCILTPQSDGADDTPNIVQAFKECSRNSKITFTNGTFNINSVMDTRGLLNVEINLLGTLLVMFPHSIPSISRQET